MQEFFDIVTTKTGRLNAKSLNYDYFVKINKANLWNEFQELTNESSDLPLRWRIHLAKQGIYKTPKCEICGKNVKEMDRKLSRFCSPACSSKTSKKKESFANRDEAAMNEKRKKTMLEKYGYEYNSQRPDVKPVLQCSKVNKNIEEKLKDVVWLEEQYITKKRTSVDIAAELGCDYSTVLAYCRNSGFDIRKRSNYSMIELQVIEYVKSLGFDPKHSIWGIIPKKELDIVIEEKKLAIEIDGLYWHSLETKDKHDHVNKTIEANKAGYDLIHFTDYEWKHKQDICQSIIRSRLGLNTKIHARKCEIREVETQEEREFLTRNHINGYSVSKFRFGLYFNDELVQIATFGVPRFNKEYELELVRMASKNGLTVIGGFAKLLSKFKALNKSLITYCDRSKFSGNGYLKSGFKFSRYTDIGYFWTDGDEVKSRFQSQKQELVKWYKNYDETLSQDENMYKAGYQKFYDCGNMVFEMKGYEY